MKRSVIHIYFKTFLTVLLLPIILTNCAQMEKEMNTKKNCFRTFNKLTFEGIDPISCENPNYPYLTISEDDSIYSMNIHIEESLNFNVDFEKREGYMMRSEDTYAEDEALFPYSREVNYYSNGIEYTFTYLGEINDSSFSSGLILSEYQRISKNEKITYEFSIFDETHRILLNEAIKFDEIEQFEDSYLTQNAALIGIKTIKSKQLDKTLILDIHYKSLTDNAQIRSKEIYSVEKYPAFYIDFVSARMFLEEIEE